MWEWRGARMAESVNKVVIIGAGMAGMSAALRLLERGFEVTLYEQDDFVGGMMHSFQDPNSGEWREHSYHMMSNWYHNFWKITEELGVRDNFEARDLFKYLYEGEYPEMTELVNAGAPQDLWKNIFSGAAEPADPAEKLATVIGSSSNDEAKIGGITPAMFNFNGRWLLCAAYILRPCWRLA